MSFGDEVIYLTALSAICKEKEKNVPSHNTSLRLKMKILNYKGLRWRVSVFRRPPSGHHDFKFAKVW